jgi:hypothetical protein
MINPNLKHLVNLDIPKPVKKQYGFLDVIKKTQDETINSSIYAYFLNALENPVLSEIFLKSLLNLLRTKYKIEFEFEEFDALTEVTTNLGRIDIVLLQKDRNKVIIIENKINHINNNPLADYWNHFSEINCNNKLGILLTLKILPVKDNFNYDPNDEDVEEANRATKEQINDSDKSDLRFVNITHSEWINEIKSNGLPFNLDPRTHIYLNDFLKTMENISKVTEMDENAKFYFEHAVRIQDAIATKNNALDYINSELMFVANEISKTPNTPDYKLFGNNENYRYLKDASKKYSTYYTIYYKGLLNGNLENYIILEMKQPDMDLADKILEYIDEESYKGKIEKGVIRDNYYVQLFVKKINISNPADFGRIISDEINQNFQPVMIKILKFIDDPTNHTNK